MPNKKQPMAGKTPEAINYMKSFIEGKSNKKRQHIFSAKFGKGKPLYYSDISTNVETALYKIIIINFIL